MGKSWNVTIDSVPYAIQLKPYDIVINGEKTRLKSLYSKRTMLQSQYTVSVGSKEALLVLGMFGHANLVIDGKDCATGEDYVPLVVPKWAYVFIVLHLVNLINGLLGVLIAFIGIGATISVSTNRKFSTPVKVLLDFIILLVIGFVEIGILLALYRGLYGAGF